MSLKYLDLGKAELRCRLSSLGPETHLLLEPRSSAGFEYQLKLLKEGLKSALKTQGLAPEGLTFLDLFLSDPLHQPIPSEGLFNGPLLSIKGMSPLGPARLALRAVHLQGLHRTQLPGGLLLEGQDQRQLWLGDLHSLQGGAKEQTQALLSQLQKHASKQSFSLREHLVRTWVYVQDIDLRYSAMVQGRARFYEALGFSEALRFPASTGIGARPLPLKALVSVNALLVKGPEIRRMEAPGFMPPASSYGVGFDRGIELRFSEHRQLHLSGTASINAQGQILHAEVEAQTERTLENLEALLSSSGAGPQDLAYLLIYLRDWKDGERVQERIKALGWGEIPSLKLHAPVCRPGWRLEIEGLALSAL